MFRKLHSNRDPGDTILTEIRTTFAPYFERCSKTITQILKQKPKTVFAAMITLLFFSAGMSFTVLRNKEPAEKIKISVKVNTVNDGFTQILSASAGIKQCLALKHQIDSLSAKKTLTKQDSEVLLSDLDKLRQLNKPLPP
ncbi:MAG: hypothetical protein M3O71_21295 [Bacteroidota bacterium]|nr:hypothetical protein [Bacteroidota bacterium]